MLATIGVLRADIKDMRVWAERPTQRSRRYLREPIMHRCLAIDMPTIRHVVECPFPFQFSRPSVGLKPRPVFRKFIGKQTET